MPARAALCARRSLPRHCRPGTCAAPGTRAACTALHLGLNNALRHFDAVPAVADGAATRGNRVKVVTFWITFKNYFFFVKNISNYSQLVSVFLIRHTKSRFKKLNHVKVRADNDWVSVRAAVLIARDAVVGVVVAGLGGGLSARPAARCKCSGLRSRRPSRHAPRPSGLRRRHSAIWHMG